MAWSFSQLFKKYDLITIGDTVTDCFIHLEDATVRTANQVEELCFRFGDKLPYDSATEVSAVGNSANVAAAASKLGLKVALVSNLGQDRDGQKAVRTLKQAGVQTKLIKLWPQKKTNYHYVLWYGDDRTILIKHEQYDYLLPALSSPKWLYLSSLGELSLPFHEKISQYLATHPEVKLAFQPGTYQIKFGSQKLASLYHRAEILFCNRDEARRILNTSNNEINNLLASLKALGPKIVVITDGKAGAYLSDEQNRNWFMPIFPDRKIPLERTGAGDAFAATMVSALIKGKNLLEALEWAPVNSAEVVQAIGAQAGQLTEKVLLEHLAKKPSTYQAKNI